MKSKGEQDLSWKMILYIIASYIYIYMLYNMYLILYVI